MDKREQLQRWQNLVKSQAWEELVELGKAQIANRERMIFAMDVESIESMAKFNLAKGEILGIRLFLSLPEIFVDELLEELNVSSEAGE
jgi:hypothetical protein